MTGVGRCLIVMHLTSKQTFMRTARAHATHTPLSFVCVLASTDVYCVISVN